MYIHMGKNQSFSIYLTYLKDNVRTEQRMICSWHNPGEANHGTVSHTRHSIVQ